MMAPLLESYSMNEKKDLRSQPTVEMASLSFSDPWRGAPMTCCFSGGGLPSPLLLLGPNFWHHPSSSCCWLLNRLSRHFKFGNQCNKLLLLKITQITWFGLPLSLFPLDSFCRKRRGKCKCPHRPGPLPSSLLYKPPYSQEPKCCPFLEQLICPKFLALMPKTF